MVDFGFSKRDVPDGDIVNDTDIVFAVTLAISADGDRHVVGINFAFRVGFHLHFAIVVEFHLVSIVGCGEVRPLLRRHLRARAVAAPFLCPLVNRDDEPDFPVGTALLIKPVDHPWGSIASPGFDNHAEPFVSELRWVEPAHQRHLIRDVKRGSIGDFYPTAGIAAQFNSVAVFPLRPLRFVKRAVVFMPRPVLRRVAFAFVKREIQHQICLADCLAHRSAENDETE